MRDLALWATLIFLSVFGSIVGTCLVLVVAGRQEKRRKGGGKP